MWLLAHLWGKPKGEIAARAGTPCYSPGRDGCSLDYRDSPYLFPGHVTDRAAAAVEKGGCDANEVRNGNGGCDGCDQVYNLRGFNCPSVTRK